jgi:hypothetical protein
MSVPILAEYAPPHGPQGVQPHIDLKPPVFVGDVNEEDDVLLLVIAETLARFWPNVRPDFIEKRLTKGGVVLSGIARHHSVAGLGRTDRR